MALLSAKLNDLRKRRREFAIFSLAFLSFSPRILLETVGNSGARPRSRSLVRLFPTCFSSAISAFADIRIYRPVSAMQMKTYVYSDSTGAYMYLYLLAKSSMQMKIHVYPDMYVLARARVCIIHSRSNSKFIRKIIPLRSSTHAQWYI